MEYNIELPAIRHLSKVTFMEDYLRNTEFIHFFKFYNFYLLQAEVPVLV